jgi:hypothetical protein
MDTIETSTFLEREEGRAEEERLSSFLLIQY